MVAVCFATDTTRLTTLQLLTECPEELGGAPTEVLTDRDPALVIGSTPSGRPVVAPQWVDLAEVLGIRPRACRPYRAKTKGKVERVVRELREFADQVVAAAILDRLLHHATVINIKGKSYRMRRHADALDPSKERPML
jgi:transposase